MLNDKLRSRKHGLTEGNLATGLLLDPESHITRGDAPTLEPMGDQGSVHPNEVSQLLLRPQLFLSVELSKRHSGHTIQEKRLSVKGFHADRLKRHRESLDEPEL